MRASFSAGTRRRRHAQPGSARQPGNYERNVAATAELTRLAEAKGAAVSQLALAWLLPQGDDIVPIPGTRTAARVAENVAAASLVLTADDLAQIARILPRGGFGARFPEGIPVWE